MVVFARQRPSLREPARARKSQTQDTFPDTHRALRIGSEHCFILLALPPASSEWTDEGGLSIARSLRSRGPMIPTNYLIRSTDRRERRRTEDLRRKTNCRVRAPSTIIKWRKKEREEGEGSMRASLFPFQKEMVLRYQISQSKQASFPTAPQLP